MDVDEFMAFLETRPGKEHWELIEGVAVLMTPASIAQRRIAHNLSELLNRAFEAPCLDLFAYIGTEIRANERKAPKGPSAIPVSVAPVLQEVVPFRLLAIGNVEAYATVSVKARVDGQIVEVSFKEGEEVPKGRALFKIDPRPYEAALRQAEANFLRDTSQKDQARSQERAFLLLEQSPPPRVVSFSRRVRWAH